MIERGTDDPTMSIWAALMAAIGIGPDQTFALSDEGADALLQRSLAEVFFIDRIMIRPEHIGVYLSRDFQSIGDALLVLANDSPDICAAGLDVFHRLVQLKTLRGPIVQLSLVLYDIYSLILSATDPEVLSKAQQVLADGLCRSGMAHEVLDLIREPDLLSTLDKLEEQCLYSAPSNAQSALHLLGFFLDWTYQTYPAQRKSLWPRIARYIGILRMTIQDTNPFDARFAAVNSICALNNIWRISISPSSPTSHLLLGLSTTLYDLLNDDDDEIRDAAALATTALLNAQASPKTPQIAPSVPILTSHRLASFLTTHFPTSQTLCKEALRRLTTTSPREPLFATPFSQTLAQERQEDTTLFATEKQNLFFDPTLDAIFWSRILTRCTASPALKSSLGAWVQEALGLLLQTTEEEETDGALGWTSKTEVFTLGMRVLCAADVALTWGVQNAASIRRLVVRFAEVGRQKEVNGIWLGKADKVVERDILALVKGAGARVKAVGKGLEIEKAKGESKGKADMDEQSVLDFLKGLGARVRATEGGLMKKAGM